VIYEIRTYQIAPGSLAEVEKRFGEAYEYRKKYSELTAFWHTEVGPLNEIIHVWGYNDLAERAKIRAEAAKDANWPPKISEFIRKMRAEIVNAFDFVPKPTPGKMGPVFEIRYYTLKGGTLPDTAKGWEAKLPDRMKLSPVVLAGGVELARPTASCTSGRTRAWTSACRSATKPARRACGHRPAAAIASSRSRTRSCCRRPSRPCSKRIEGRPGSQPGRPERLGAWGPCRGPHLRKAAISWPS